MQVERDEVGQPLKSLALSQEIISDESTKQLTGRMIPESMVQLAESGFIQIDWNIPLQKKLSNNPKEFQKYICQRRVEFDFDRCACREFCGAVCVNRKVYIECHPDNCSFEHFKDCSNRRLAKGPKTCLEIFDTESVRGMGLRTIESIQCGEFIVEYVGEILKLATKEGEKRYNANFSEGKFYMMELQNNIYIDASRYGNYARFINHSCHPNCIVERWNVNGEEHVCVFASRNIKPNEQLTYNYDFDHWPQAIECRCGSFNCITKRNKLKQNGKSLQRLNSNGKSGSKKGGKGKSSKKVSSRMEQENQENSQFATGEQCEGSASKKIPFSTLCEVEIPHMYVQFVRSNISRLGSDVEITFPEHHLIQSPQKTQKLSIKTASQSASTLVHSQISRLVAQLKYRIIEIDKDLHQMVSPLLETIKSKGILSYGIGVDRLTLKTISRVQFTKITFGLYVIARRTDFDWVFNYLQKELESLIVDYFVVGLGEIATFYERLDKLDRRNLLIKLEGSDMKTMVYSIKGKRLDAIRVKEQLTLSDDSREALVL